VQEVQEGHGARGAETGEYLNLNIFNSQSSESRGGGHVTIISECVGEFVIGPGAGLDLVTCALF
jgi:hypothetical protein